MVEVWKDIVGFEGLYKVSNLGNVMSCHYTNHKGKNPFVMKKTKSSTGYWHVQLYKDGKSYTTNVHKIVATAFIENPNNAPEVNHIDGNKSNNSVYNLEWVTKSENMRHAINHGLRTPSPMIGRKGSKSPHSKTIIQYDLNGNFVKLWYGISEAARLLRCSSSSISSCICGNNKSAGGYIWRELTNDYIPMKIDVPEVGHNHRNKSYAKVRVMQLSIDDVPIKAWHSLSSASRDTGCSKYKIKQCCQGSIESINGFKWRFDS